MLSWQPFKFSNLDTSHMKRTKAYKGHCVLCKDVLSFVFQTFDFQVLCFGFCVLFPVLLFKGAIGT